MLYKAFPDGNRNKSPMDTIYLMHEKIVLAVGERTKVKTSFLGSFNIIYCGMPAENIFSIALRESSGNQGYAMNLYYPKNIRTIRVKGSEFTVFDVTPEMLTMEMVIRNRR